MRRSKRACPPLSLSSSIRLRRSITFSTKPFMGRIYNDIVETVGRTPLVRLNRVTAGVEATILLKCEFFNPLGSVKDRIGMAMIEAAEKSGQLTKETTII